MEPVYTKYSDLRASSATCDGVHNAEGPTTRRRRVRRPVGTISPCAGVAVSTALALHPYSRGTALTSSSMEYDLKST
eukprot:2839344-Rhodomonas_salina.2